MEPIHHTSGPECVPIVGTIAVALFVASIVYTTIGQYKLNMEIMKSGRAIIGGHGLNTISSVMQSPYQQGVTYGAYQQSAVPYDPYQQPPIPYGQVAAQNPPAYNRY